MTWTKLSDDFSDDCWELSDAAFRLHVEGLVWSGRKLLDLRLAKEDVVRWAKRPGAADELVAAGWWHNEGEYYFIVHHGAYQRSRDQVVQRQESSQRNGQKGGRPKGPPREQAPRKPRSDNPIGNPPDNPDVNPPGSSESTETQTQTHLPTQMDRTGQAGRTTGGSDFKLAPAESDSVSANGDGWPKWGGEGADPFEDYR